MNALASPALTADAVVSANFLRDELGGRAIHLVAIPADGGPTEGRWFGDDASAAAQWAADRNSAGRNVYWTVNGVRPGVNRKPGKSDIVAARFAHVDIDPPKGCGFFDKAAKVAALESAALPPSFIVDSGGGVQAFWALDGDTTTAEVEAQNRGLVARFGGDAACWNVDRLMRLPGTINWPNAKKRSAGRSPALAALVSPDLVGAKVAAAELKAAYPVAANDTRAPDIIAIADSQPQSPVSLGIATDDPLAELLTDPPGEDRSNDTYAAACEMVRHGFDDAQIRGTLLNPDLAISGHCLAQADPQRAATRAISKARREVAKERNGYIELQSFGAGPISASPYSWPAPHTIPPRQWLYGRQLLRGTVSVIVAPGGTGKTAYTIGIALALSTGRALLGKEVPDGPQSVWLWNLEDARDELDRAIAAAAWAHGIKPSDAAGRLFVDSGLDGAGLCTAVQTRNGFTLLRPVYDALVAEIKRRRIDCLIVDPFVSSQTVPENDNGAIDAVAKAWAWVAATTGCAIVLVHHTSKLGGGEVTAERARGASALVNAARSVTALNRMTQDEAQRFGIKASEARRYFRSYDDKNNRAPAADASDWFRLESVDLPNGIDGDLTGDSVGVVVPWQAPTIENMAAIEPTDAVLIQRAVAQGEWREHPSADLWAGKPIARALGLDPQADRAKVKAVIQACLRDGTLKVVLRNDAKRMLRSWIVPGDPAQPPSGGTKNDATVPHQPTAARCGTAWQKASSAAPPQSLPFRGDCGGAEAAALGKSASANGTTDAAGQTSPAADDHCGGAGQ